MKRTGLWVCLVFIFASLIGCASAPKLGEQTSGLTTSESFNAKGQENINNDTSGRMLVWNAYLKIEVDDVKAGMDKSVQIVNKYGGYLESSSGDGETSGLVVMKIPASSFQDAIKATQGIGKVINTQITSRDVTDQFVDVQARLKSKVELRDRLRKLFDKATDIKDVIAIETELTRLQGEIESMEGTIKRLQSQVDYATINVTFERKTILGPVGLVLKGIWWGITKLFVIRD